jgi:hypothetical protein
MVSARRDPRRAEVAVAGAGGQRETAGASREDRAAELPGVVESQDVKGGGGWREMRRSRQGAESQVGSHVSIARARTPCRQVVLMMRKQGGSPVVHRNT